MAEKRTLRLAALGTALCGIFFAGGAWAVAAGPTVVMTAPQRAESGADSRAKILSALETRTTDGKVIEKAEEKLRAVDGRELRLMASLSDRIEENSGSPGADIAFSLITALLVLT